MRVPVVEFDGIDIDQIPLSEGLGVVEDGLNRAGLSEGVPIAPLDTIVIMKLIAGRSQDLADVEAIVESGADREFLRTSIDCQPPRRAGRVRTVGAHGRAMPLPCASRV